MRSSREILNEIYGDPSFTRKGLKHGPGGTGDKGPCDPGCRKCKLEAELKEARARERSLADR